MNLIQRSLAQKTDLLFFDEPFVGVDQKTEDIIFQIFHELANIGKIVLVVMPKHCLWERFYFTLKGYLKKANRRNTKCEGIKVKSAFTV